MSKWPGKSSTKLFHSCSTDFFPKVWLGIETVSWTNLGREIHRGGGMLPKMWCLWPGRFHISLTGEFLTLKPKISSFACSRWWFQIFFYVHPYLEKVSNLTNLFQLGWNHQLDVASDEIYPIFGRVNPWDWQIPRNAQPQAFSKNDLKFRSPYEMTPWLISDPWGCFFPF